jgi:hypothetical protein
MEKWIAGQRDASLDTLLDLDGQVLVIDEKGGHWVKFEVKRVMPTKERPHGLDYSFTLHGDDNERLVGSITRMLCGSRPDRAAKERWPTIISIGCARFVHMSTGTRQRCWRISGPKWTRF